VGLLYRGWIFFDPCCVVDIFYKCRGEVGLILEAKLYLVGTPIGNIGEISERARVILSEVDVIAAEDTRNTGVLLKLLGIAHKKFISYHKLNELKRQEILLDMLKSGQSIALVSDSGMPCISDPGFLLVAAASQVGIDVVAVSGASAVINAVAVSGFPAEPFLFIGFLPRKESEILRAFSGFRENIALVFYESPKRILKTAALLAFHYPEMKICLCNDMTKLFERTYRGTAIQVLAELEDNPKAEKGEYTGVAYVEFTPELKAPLSLEAMLVDTMIRQQISLKEAISVVAQDSGLPKKEVYRAALGLKRLEL